MEKNCLTALKIEKQEESIPHLLSIFIYNPVLFLKNYIRLGFPSRPFTNNIDNQLDTTITVY